MSGVALFLALLLAGSAAHKALARDRLSHSAARLVGGTAFAGTLALLLAGTFEMLAAMALVITPLRAVGALLAAGIWVAYAVALLRRKGETLDCGCDLSSRAHPVGWFAILRPVVLAAVALAVATLPTFHWTYDAPFAAAAMLALYLAASELGAVSSHKKGITG
ncbi:MAG: MauE/DoxX family redox-associated membrane protein [Sphingobium sp.]